MADSAISVDRLSRRFQTNGRTLTALDDVSFEVAEGEIVALLGTNGAGKTTLTKILATLLLPSDGESRLFGHDVVRQAATCRTITSVVFGGDRGLYGRLSGRDNLRFFGMLAGMTRAELRSRMAPALEQVGLAEAADRRVETYSKGMKQRLHIAIGFLPAPRLLLLDEPTVGLDPDEAGRLRAAVARLRDSGVTVLLTSHYLLDVEELADRVLLLENGRITRDLPLEAFVGLAGYVAAVVVRGRGPLPEVDAGLPGAVSTADLTGRDGEWELTLRLKAWDETVFQHLSGLFRSSEVLDLQVRAVRLEEAFAQAQQGAP